VKAAFVLRHPVRATTGAIVNAPLRLYAFTTL
jgi:hypothetical protein